MKNNLNYTKCIKPNYAIVTDIKKGKEQLKFLPFKPDINSPWNLYKQYQFGCGKCLYCMNKKNREWTNRLLLESKWHTEKYFLTLTYNNENLPNNNTLIKRDYQNFLKRYRKAIYPIQIRYYAVGEYGEEKGRAHYHMLIYGHIPNDLKKINETLYDSEQINKLWKKGFVTIGIDLKKEVIKYAANYMGKLSEYNIETQLPPFSHGSTNPGIGAWAVAKIEKDTETKKLIIKEFDKTIYETDSIYVNGKQPIPKYFDKLAEKYGIDLKEIKKQRQEKYAEIEQQEITLAEKKQYIRKLEMEKGNINHLFKWSNKKQKEAIEEFGKDWIKVQYGSIKEQIKNWTRK